MKIKTSPLILIISFLLLSSSFCDDKLFFVLTHFRHGARAPIFPTDSATDDFGMEWKTPGELSLGGHRMHYLLGAYNRLRYIENENQNFNFLSKTFDPHEIYVISSDYNRTFQSAYSQLQGLYPPDESKTLNDKQKKYSIPELPKDEIEKLDSTIENLGDAYLPNYINLLPVHNFQHNDFIYRNFDNPKCKTKTYELMKKNINNDIIQARLKTFKENWQEYFENFFVNEKKKEYDYETVEKLADLFITDISEGFEFKQFKDETKLNETQLEEIYYFFVEFVGRTMNNYQYGDPERKLIKLDMSPLFKEMIEYIKRRIKREFDLQEEQPINPNDYSCPKLVMVSGHDSMISVMLLFLGLMYDDPQKFWKVPVYAANIAFEVYNTKETFSIEDYSQYKIKVFFNGESIKDENNEDVSFYLDDFIERVNNIAWGKDEIYDFCGIVEKEIIYINETINITETKTVIEKDETLAVVFGVISAIFLVISVVLFILWRKSKISSEKIEEGTLVN